MRPIQRCAITVLAVMLLSSSDEPTGVAQDSGVPVDMEKFRPEWRTGDAWIIETVSRQVQVREAAAEKQTGVKIQWKFTVEGTEQLGGRSCFRIKCHCISGREPRPQVSLWVDTEALALRQIQAQVRVGGQMRTLMESYEFSGDQPTPVVSPLSALPVDLPLFLAGVTKGKQTFRYESLSGPPGSKNVGDVSFAFQIEQDIKTASADATQGLIDEQFAKNLTAQPVVEVQLKTIDRQVRQLWRAELPWPAYSDNGLTVARLVKVIPVQNTDQP